MCVDLLNVKNNRTQNFQYLQNTTKTSNFQLEKTNVFYDFQHSSSWFISMFRTYKHDICVIHP
jgi:hypothetical protein